MSSKSWRVATPGGCFPVSAVTYTISSAGECDIVLDDPTVSGQHCRLEITAGGGVRHQSRSTIRELAAQRSSPTCRDA